MGGNICSFELVQHTPIIHFKPNDIPIRATELKPAFDRYLIENVEEFMDFKNNEKMFKKFFRYKVEIEFKNKRVDTILKRTLYFGDTKKTKFVYADVVVKFFSFDSKLIKIIDSYFPAFVSQYNFGMRTTKGFGSFTAKKFIKPKDKRVFYIDLSIENWMEELNYFYKSLRQGINERGFYLKPLVFEYACAKHLNWEKKKIKEKFVEFGIVNQNANHQVNSCGYNEYRIFRDVLGLSTSQGWMGYKKGDCDLITVTKEHISYNDRQKKTDKIDRFPSPLFFKPIRMEDNMRVYFWINSLTIRGKFKIEAVIKKKIKQNGRNKKVNCERDNSKKLIANLDVVDMDWDKFFKLMFERKNRFNHNSRNFIEKKLAKAYGSLEELR